MANSTTDLTLEPVGSGGQKRYFNVAVAASTLIYRATMVAQNITTGQLVPATTANSGAVVGMSTQKADNSSGSAGAIECEVESDQVYRLNNSSGDALAATHKIGDPVYAEDDNTVAASSAGGTLPLAGSFQGLDADGKVMVYIDSVQNGMAAGPSGAVGGAGGGNVLFSLYDFREVDASGDVGDATANGGVLASDTTPILRGDAAESQEISWATGNTDKIACQKALPAGFDGTQAVTVEMTVSSGTTNAASITVESGWNGGALVSDAADDSTTKSATAHKVTATIAAADIPDGAEYVTLILTPPAHATDTIQLHSMRLLNG